MRSIYNTTTDNTLICLHNQDWLDKQRKAGKIAAAALKELKWYCDNKTFHSVFVLNEIIERFIIEQGGFPTFKGYKGFPAGVCISVNKQLVHGIPGDTVLQNGDKVSFDLGVTVEGAIADTALTLIFGPPKSEKHLQLVRDTDEALRKGIEAVQVGKHLGCIGHAISKYAKNKGYGVIVNYGGHGLTWDTPHAPPFVANKAESNEGVRIQPGMTLAIEPMLTIGSTTTHVDSDGWTVWCDAEMAAHAEHTIYIHLDGMVEVITERNYLSVNERTLK
jgi:methionyl aminopeptidase